MINYTESLTALMQDIVARVPTLSFIDVADVLVFARFGRSHAEGAFAWLLQRPALYRLSARLGRLLQRPLARNGRIRRLPLFFGSWTRTRDLPPIAARTFHERWAELEREARR